MYNPTENEYYNEWFELYNPTNRSINISGWSVTDNLYEDYLEINFDYGNKSYLIPPKKYAIVTDKGTKIFEYVNISNDTNCFYVDDKSIGNGLGNKGDKLILKNNSNSTIDCVEWINNYSDVDGKPIDDVSENYTLSKIKPLKTKSSKFDYYEGIPTPGKKNIILKRGITKIKNKKTEFYLSKYEEITINLEIENLGDFNDNITIKTKEISKGFKVILNDKNIFLKPGYTKNITIRVKPSCFGYEGMIKVVAESEKEINESDEIEFEFIITNPDLWLKKIKCYNEEKNETNSIFQGENIRIKAFLKNLGVNDAENVLVSFYKDDIDPNNLIGTKFYETISKYQKYPSAYIDTTYFTEGYHKIFVCADLNDNIFEIDETNNILSFDIKVIDTRPSFYEKKLVFTELYFHTHSGLKNEFFEIYNPNNIAINISGWYITNEPNENKLDQKKIVFPKNTFISSKSSLIITQSAEDFRFETNIDADFEYSLDSDIDIKDMENFVKTYFSNEKGMISLKNSYNHTVDSFCYGNISKNCLGWKGESLDSLGKGVVYKRNNRNNIFIDTNTSFDFISSRTHKIGQTDLKPRFFNFSGNLETFVSPDNSFNTIKKYLGLSNQSINLNIYEFTSSFLCDELINCLKRNVSVNILIEGGPVGGVSNTEKYLLNRIHTYGGTIRIKSSDIKNKFFSRYRFNHAKYLVIDNKTTIIESCNWAETGVPVDSSFGNREWGVVVNNKEFSEYYLNVFLDDWDISYNDVFSFEEIDWYVPHNFYLDDYYYRGNYKESFDSKLFSEKISIKPVFSPDTSFDEIYTLLDSAEKSIYIEQLYIYKYWDEKLNPFLELLSKKANNGIDVRVILNYNPFYDSTNKKMNETKKYLEEKNVKVKFIYTNWSVFTNVHNKGVIVDNRSVLISSINWNENSFMNNREAGIIIKNKNVSKYYSEVFFFDWNLKEPKEKIYHERTVQVEKDNTIYIVAIYTLTLALIFQDWRKRKWT